MPTVSWTYRTELAYDTLLFLLISPAAAANITSSIAKASKSSLEPSSFESQLDDVGLNKCWVGIENYELRVILSASNRTDFACKYSNGLHSFAH